MDKVEVQVNLELVLASVLLGRFKLDSRAPSNEGQGFRKTKGDRNTKIYALTNRKGKAHNFILTPGNKHEVTVVLDLLEYGEGRIVLKSQRI